jgi:hypothetical protein
MSLIIFYPLPSSSIFSVHEENFPGNIIFPFSQTKGGARAEKGAPKGEARTRRRSIAAAPQSATNEDRHLSIVEPSPYGMNKLKDHDDLKKADH